MIRGLDNDETAQKMMDANRIYYNYLRPHQALNGKTPAQQATIDNDSTQNWLTLIKKATEYSATNLSKGVDRK